MKFEVFMLVKV